MENKTLLQLNRTIRVNSLIPKEFCYYFTHVLLRAADLDCVKDDTQVPTAKAVIKSSIIFDALQERLWSTIENIIGEELLPTCSYSRLYSNGDVLKEHIDRPACEVSVTLQLGRSHNYSWPIYMEGARFDLNEGDAVIYEGCEAKHWREICQGPEGYYSGQVFLHFVRKNGSNVWEAGDSTNRKPPPYDINRTAQMENK